MNIEYVSVDVFTQTPLEGNPLAVFPDGSNLDEEMMQRIARELNLSETTFVTAASRADCAANVRIFTPNYEMRFAGHPTIGTAWVLRDRGMVSPQVRSFSLEEPIGPIGVRVDEGEDPILWLSTPPISKGETFDRAACAAALGLRAEDLLPGVPCGVFTAGNPNLYVAVRDPKCVDRAKIDTARFDALRGDETLCLYVFASTPAGAYSRMFAPELGVVEDPATGSAAGPLAAFMIDAGLREGFDGERFTIEQGTKMERRSILHVLVRGRGGAETIEIGGHVRAVARATMTL